MTFDKRLLRRYKRLRWHRCLLVEAMRVIAFRNMDHMYVTRLELGVSGWADPVAFGRVLDKMLLDQDMEPTKPNRFVLGWAGWASWDIDYMCLLYAGVEQYEAVSAEHPEIRFSPIEMFLLDNRNLVEHLRRVRNKLLHPLKSGEYGDSLSGLGVAARHIAPDIFLALERLQNHLDDFLEHFRDILKRSRDEEIKGLPVEVLVAYNRGHAEKLESLVKTSASVEERSWARGSLDEFDAIVKSAGLDAGREVEITSAQSGRVDRLHQVDEAIGLALPKRPYRKSKDSVQTPVAPQMYAVMLLSGFGGRVAELEKRLPERVVQHRSGLLELLMRSIAIFNEMYAALISRFETVFPDVPVESLTADEKLWMEASRRSTPTKQGADLEQALVEVAPLSIALGLLTEPLRIYHQVIRGHPELMRAEIKNDTLDETLKVFGLLRNSIFHVPDWQTDVFGANELMAHAQTWHGDYMNVAGGLVQFFQGRDETVAQHIADGGIESR